MRDYGGVMEIRLLLNVAKNNNTSVMWGSDDNGFTLAFSCHYPPDKILLSLTF